MQVSSISGRAARSLDGNSHRVWPRACAGRGTPLEKGEPCLLGQADATTLSLEFPAMTPEACCGSLLALFSAGVVIRPSHRFQRTRRRSGGRLIYPALGAAPDYPAELQGIVLLPVDASGRTALTQFQPDQARLKSDLPLARASFSAGPRAVPLPATRKRAATAPTTSSSSCARACLADLRGRVPRERAARERRPDPLRRSRSRVWATRCSWPRRRKPAATCSRSSSTRASCAT
jgi:hypothetical protein